MSDTVIKVENLSKKYILSHQSQERYTALRDVMANGVKNLGKKLLSPFTPHPSQSSDSQQSNSPFTASEEDFYALQDISFEIKQGDRVGIIGRNGAGKSTLLKILSRITEPTSGRIEITGRVASLLEVGTGFHPELTGRENISLNGAILGMGRDEIKRKFEEIVDFAEVEKFLDTPVKRYSSGMYVRLAFAVAAHLEPEILIVDEVLAVGDAQFQKKCLGKMEDVSAKDGRTVIFVSHNMAAVRQLCSKGIVLNKGRVIYQGSQDTAIGRYMEAVSSSNVNADRHYQHTKGNGSAQIKRIKFNEFAEGEPIIPVFGKITLSIDYVVHKKINELEFFILVYSLDGDVELSLFQRDNACFFCPLGETGTVKVSFVNSLTPGKYIISAGIFDKARHFVDWVEHVESFYVESAFEDGRAFDHRLGKTTQQGEWAIVDEKSTSIIKAID